VLEARDFDLDVTGARPAEIRDRAAGETFADLLARLFPEPGERSHRESQHRRRPMRKAPMRQGVSWRSQRESNPPGDDPEAE
jgi:hypothetical protein